MKLFKLSAFGVLSLGIAALMASCGGHSTVDGTDSNTHWLQDCHTDKDCGSLQCLCGICSKPCDELTDCAPFGTSASCEVPPSCSSPSAPTACVRPATGSGGSFSDGGAGSGGGSNGASGGSGGSAQQPDPECPAMDARSSGARCAGVVGYAFDGDICAPVMCSCEGSECGELFETIDACDRAYSACYAKRGVSRDCATHADCALRHRTCCASCGAPGLDSLLAVSQSTPLDALREAGMCLGDPNAGCPECEPGRNPSIYAACVMGECQAFDVGADAECDSDDDCSFQLKDCCGCRDAVGADLISVNQSFFRPSYCPIEMSCTSCKPPNVVADDVSQGCNEELGKCELIITPL